MKKNNIKKLLVEAENNIGHPLMMDDLREEETLSFNLTLKVNKRSDELFCLEKKDLNIYSLKFLIENIEGVSELVDFDGLLESEMKRKAELEFKKEK